MSEQPPKPDPIADALDEIKGRELEAHSERPGGNLTGPVGGWRRPDGYVLPMPRRPMMGGRR